MHTILLVDDHPVFRQGLYHLLSKADDVEVVGEADDGQMAIELVLRLQPDLVVMDINMPNLDGIEATRRITTEFPQTRVVALSVHSGKQFVRDMIQAGASGYILKESIPEEMVKGIRAVIAGEVFLSQSISKVLLSDYKTLASTTEQTLQPSVGMILHTKLHRPQISAAMIPRARLIARMEEASNQPMTLIAAPAGYGKSILASQWLEVTGLSGVWVSLDEGDNDFRSFLAYVIEAVRSVIPQQALKIKALHSSSRLPSGKEVGQYMLNDLESCAERFVMILDDYHHIRNEQIHGFLSALMTHPSPALHLVLATRRDPPLPLISLRARGGITEITQSDLRFTESETKAYLERFLHMAITDKTARIIDDKMEGWVAGLNLAAISLRDNPDQARLLEGLQGSPLYIQEYLLQEVLSKAPPPINRYLIQTAILDRFCADLCDAMMVFVSKDVPADERVSGREFIDWLVRMHFFTIALDANGQWFRYHHFFKQLLENQLLQKSSPKEIAGLHARASDWFAAQGYFEEAIQHAVTADDITKAVLIVDEGRHTILNQDRWYVLEKWLSLIPDGEFERSPKLLLAKTWLLYHHFEITQIPSKIDAAEALLVQGEDDRALQGEIDFFRGYFYYFQNDSVRSLLHLTKALKRVPLEHAEVKGQIEILYGLATQMQGEPQTALDRLDEIMALPQWQTSVARTRLLVTVVYIQIISGHLSQAITANLKLYNFAYKGDFQYALAWSLYLAGLIHFYRAEHKGAIECFSHAIEQKSILHTRAVIDSMIGLCLTYQAIDSPGQARDMMDRIHGYAETIDDPAGRVLADACSARLSILQDDTKGVSDFLRASAPPPENMVWWLEIPAVTYCRALINDGSNPNLEMAEALLREHLQLNQTNHNTSQTIQLMPLLALACSRQGKSDEALYFMDQALELAAPNVFVQPFVETGSAMTPFLRALRKKHADVGTIDTILIALGDDRPAINADDAGNTELRSMPIERPKGRSQSLVDPLTNRELDVLELLADRLQTKEIAAKLIVSSETVKSHLKNIYQKLDASKRREAVEKAQKLGIL